MKPVHWIAIGMFLTGLSAQLGGLQHGWRDALTPLWVSGVISQAGSIIVALNSGRIGATAPEVVKQP